MRFLIALAIHCGTIIGVGIFALPFSVTKAGFIPSFFLFIILTLFLIFLNLFYGEVILRIGEKKRLPGYSKVLLNKPLVIFSYLISILTLYGAILAYLIISGRFLFNLFPLTNPLIWTLGFAFGGAILIYFGRKPISFVESFLLLFLLGILILFFKEGGKFINFENFYSVQLKNLFLPYGSILFSLWGISIVPEIREFLKGREDLFKKELIFSIIISSFIYLLFVILVVGISGKNTSYEAISGLSKFLGEKIIKLGFLFGILTVFTSFITLGLTLKKVFFYDLGLSHFLSWLLSWSIPLFIFLIGIQEFIKTVVTTGGILLGFQGILVILLHRKAKVQSKFKPFFSIPFPSFLYWVFILFLVGGISYEIFHLVGFNY